MRFIKDEFNHHYHSVKTQFDNNTPLVNCVAGVGTSSIVGSAASIAGWVMMGAGMLAAGATVAALGSFAGLGILIGTLVTNGRAVPAMTAASLGGIATPFTAAVKGVKSLFKGSNKTPKLNPDRPKPY